MTEIEVTIVGANSTAKKSGKLTSGMVGVPVSFILDDLWNGLTIIPVFRCGDVIKDNVLLDNRTTVPHEVLRCDGDVLYIGAEGRTTDGKLVIPTTWARVGTVQRGAKATGDIGLEPTPSQFDRFMEEVGQLDGKVIAAVTEAVESGALKGEKGDTGATGAAGKDGEDGTSVTVKSVSESTADGGSNVVTFSDGKTLIVKNGTKGSTGERGATGPQGEKGDPGEQGPRGIQGEPGKDGADGKTPVKGTDYFTASDKAEMVNAVIEALPVYGGEVV